MLVMLWFQFYRIYIFVNSIVVKLKNPQEFRERLRKRREAKKERAAAAAG